MGRRPLCVGDGYLTFQIAGFMAETTSPILIYGICETPKLILDAYKSAQKINAVNGQYICLDYAPEDLRIGDGGWLELIPDQLLKFEKNEDIFLFAKEILLSKTHPFSKPLRNALISYFNWVEKKSAEIENPNKFALIDPLFSNPDQICFSAFLPLPHPKIPIDDKKGNFEGTASFDLGFHVNGKIYLISFSDGQFIRKSEREFRQRLITENDKFKLIELPKPKDSVDVDENFIKNLLASIPEISHFIELKALPHGLYYPVGLNNINEIG